MLSLVRPTPAPHRSRRVANDGVDDMTKTVWFKVAVRITYDDEKSLRVAMRAVRDELSIEQWSAGDDNFSIKSGSVKPLPPGEGRAHE